MTYDRKSLADFFKQRNYPATLPCPLTNLPIRKEELELGTSIIVKQWIDEFVSVKENEVNNHSAQNIPSAPCSPAPQNGNALVFFAAAKPQDTNKGKDHDKVGKSKNDPAQKKRISY